jgi:hypothetical protein
VRRLLLSTEDDLLDIIIRVAVRLRRRQELARLHRHRRRNPALRAVGLRCSSSSPHNYIPRAVYEQLHSLESRECVTCESDASHKTHVFGLSLRPGFDRCDQNHWCTASCRCSGNPTKACGSGSLQRTADSHPYQLVRYMANKECQWCQARAAPESYRLNGWLWI